VYVKEDGRSGFVAQVVAEAEEGEADEDDEQTADQGPARDAEGL